MKNFTSLFMMDEAFYPLRLAYIIPSSDGQIHASMSTDPKRGGWKVLTRLVKKAHALLLDAVAPVKILRL
jgi:hypothetical protein